MERLYHCLECGQDKDWSEMHTKILCKVCWGDAYTDLYHKGAKVGWAVRRAHGTVKTKKR